MLSLHIFLGRKRYERRQGDVNHRNGSYDRNFTLKGIGEVGLNVPRDRKGDFKTHVIPRGKRYEDTIRQDLCLMFLTGIRHPKSFYDFQKTGRVARYQLAKSAMLIKN